MQRCSGLRDHGGLRRGDFRPAAAFSSPEGPMRYINDWTLIAGTVVAGVICACLVWLVY